MNIAVKELPLKQDSAVAQSLEADKPNLLRRALVAKKDFAAGELIYQEQPMATALDLDLEGKGTHCSYCLRKLEAFMSIRPPNDPLGSTFCSKACQLSCTLQSHNLLFGNAVLLPADATTKMPIPDDAAKRRDVQISFAEYIKDSGKLSPLLVARCVARMISNEIVKIVPGSPVSPPPPSDLPEADTASAAASSGAEYTFYDHMDRLRFLEVPPTPAEDTEIELLRNVLNSAMAGLDDFIQDERYRVLKGKILYNAIGVSFGGGRLDKPKSGGRFEKWELTRTPYGTSRQTGTGVYRVSSYLAHSCAPSARPSFPKGTAELHLVANRSIKAGEELTISYVRSTPTEGESVAENRRVRRQELARGWRFACECTKCVAEATEGASADPETKVLKSK